MMRTVKTANTMGLHQWALLIIGTDQPATSTDRAQKYAFKATGAKLSPIVNGSEQLVSITSLPFYIRQVSLPRGSYA